MVQDYEIPSRRNFLSFSKSFTDFNRWFPEYQRQDVNVNQVSWITLKKNMTKRNVYYTFVTGQLFQIATANQKVLKGVLTFLNRWMDSCGVT